MTPPGDTVSIPVEKLKRSLRAEAAMAPPSVTHISTFTFWQWVVGAYVLRKN